MKRQFLLLFLGLTMVGGAGFLGATALSQGAAEPTRTVTVDVTNGATGPAGPAGPPGETGPIGPAGPAGDGGGPCGGAPTGYSPGILVLNAPGGQVRLWTCLGP